jgi:hypothetical protein
MSGKKKGDPLVALRKRLRPSLRPRRPVGTLRSWSRSMLPATPHLGVIHRQHKAGPPPGPALSLPWESPELVGPRRIEALRYVASEVAPAASGRVTRLQMEYRPGWPG